MKQLSMYEQDIAYDLSGRHLNNYQPVRCAQVQQMPDNASVPASTHRQEPPLAANVTEIVLAKDSVDSISLILPMLINLHQEKRWLAWIDPPIQLLKEWQKAHHNKALNEIMILRSNDSFSVFELSKRALEAGTCHAVIAWTNTLSHDEFAKLEAASAQGHSHGIILKSRLFV